MSAFLLLPPAEGRALHIREFSFISGIIGGGSIYISGCSHSHFLSRCHLQSRLSLVIDLNVLLKKNLSSPS